MEELIANEIYKIGQKTFINEDNQLKCSLAIIEFGKRFTEFDWSKIEVLVKTNKTPKPKRKGNPKKATTL